MKELYKKRKIFNYILLGLLVASLLLYFIFLITLDRNDLIILVATCIALIFIIIIIFIILMFGVIEGQYNKRIKNYIKKTKDYNKSLDLVKNLHIPNLFVYSKQKQNLNTAYLYLQINDKVSALTILEKMDLFSYNVEPEIYIIATTYLLILYLENNKVDTIKEKVLAKKLDKVFNKYHKYDLILGICNNDLTLLKNSIFHIPCLDLIIQRLMIDNKDMIDDIYLISFLKSDNKIISREILKFFINESKKARVMSYTRDAEIKTSIKEDTYYDFMFELSDIIIDKTYSLDFNAFYLELHNDSKPIFTLDSKTLSIQYDKSYTNELISLINSLAKEETTIV